MGVGQGDVLLHGEVGDDALKEPLLGDHQHPLGQGLLGRGEAHALPPDDHLAEGGPLVAADDLADLLNAGAHHAAQAQDLSLAQREIDVGKDLIAEKVLFDAAHLQQRSI